MTWRTVLHIVFGGCTGYFFSCTALETWILVFPKGKPWVFVVVSVPLLVVFLIGSHLALDWMAKR